MCSNKLDYSTYFINPCKGSDYNNNFERTRCHQNFLFIGSYKHTLSHCAPEVYISFAPVAALVHFLWIALVHTQQLHFTICS